MPHTICGLIRKEPFTKIGNSTKGQYKMYAIELSESFMPSRRQGEDEPKRIYTNYRAVLFAKTPGMIKFYDDAFKKDNYIVIKCDTLQVITRETESGVYTHLEMNGANYVGHHQGSAGTGSNTGNASKPRGNAANSSSQSGWGNPSGSNASGNSGASGADFDDDVPF